MMTTPVYPHYAGYRFPAELISHAVGLYFRFLLNSRMVEEMLAARSTTCFLTGARCFWS
jgi:putative transposase